MTTYQLVDGTDRVSATLNGIEICGAYSPTGHDYWALFVTRSIQQLTGLTTPPHREHYWGRNGKIDATRWIEMIAALYCLAAQQQEVAA